MFNWRNKTKGIRHWHCKTCQRQYKKDFYDKDRSAYKAKVLESNEVLRKRNFLFVKRYFETHPCVGCGQTDWQLLEFDHINAANKSYDVSSMIRLKHSIEKIQEEIDKCQVLCLYCHRKKTIEQLGWYKRYE